jgi:hypothetical protein
MALGRRRGDEYRHWDDQNLAPIITTGRQEDDDPIYVISALERAVKLKSGKDYAPAIALLIYLNVGGFFVDEIEVQRRMVDACQPGRGRFSSVWVIWGKRLYRCWPNPWWNNSAEFRPVPVPLKSYANEHRLFRELFGR